MSDITYEIRGNEIRLSNGKIAQFVHPITKVVRNADILVVCTSPPGRTTYNEKLSGVDFSGNIQWQIETQYPSTVVDITYEISGNKIRFSNGQIVRFEYPVTHILQFGDILVVLVWPGKEIYNENVFGVELFSNIRWQIERLYPCNVDAAYCGLHSEEGYAVVGNMKDLTLYLDPATGKIVKRRLQTHW